MAQISSPAEVASKTLKALVVQKLPPTPENYARLYAEISGIPQPPVQPITLPSPETSGEAAPALAWSGLIRDLLKQLESHHKGITLSRKKEGLEQVLSRFAANQEVLYEKIQGLLRSWSGFSASSAAPQVPVLAGEPDDPPPVVPTPSATGGGILRKLTGALGGGESQDPLADLRELLAMSLESNRPFQPELAQEINDLAQKVRGLGSGTKLPDVARQLRRFWVKLELHGGDKIRIQDGVVNLLRLLVQNVGELVADDKWLHGQIAILQDLIAQPMDKRSVSMAERSLRDALIKQSSLKQSLADAKDTLKSLMTTFIDRLGEFTESTGEYQSKMEGYTRKIGQADSLTELGHILQDIMQDTRTIHASAMRSHEELETARKKAQEAEERIRELEQQLEETSALVREDQLTGTLNRRGLGEMLERESSRSDRSRLPLCVAMLDVDNFKLFNDLLGHQAGDAALRHVSEVVRAALRPSDSIARYGGEEFLVMLPESALEAACEVVTRLQRTLTQQLFTFNGEDYVITFSAGVAERFPEESVEDLIERADEAMYQAKAAGKNQVQKADQRRE